MLFAAGFGTRMGTLTEACPKPLVKVAGRPLIDHTLDLVRSYAPTKIVANLHYLHDQIETYLTGQGVDFTCEHPDILETGGGLRAALPMLGPDPVFTMNTDAIWRGPNPLNFLADLWRPGQMDALLLCIPKPQALGHTGKGDFLIDNDGRVTRGPGLIYSGLQITRTDLLSTIPQRAFSLNLVWDEMLSDGRLHAATYPGQWCDVGKPESIQLAANLLHGTDV